MATHTSRTCAYSADCPRDLVGRNHAFEVEEAVALLLDVAPRDADRQVVLALVPNFTQRF
jgi:hypothetical protein